MFDVELDRDTPFRQAQDTTTTVPWTGEGDYREVPTKTLHNIPSLSSVKADHELIEQSAGQGCFSELFDFFEHIVL